MSQKRKIYQDVFGEYGNCISANLATLFGYELEQVPNFAVPGQTTDDWC